MERMWMVRAEAGTAVRPRSPKPFRSRRLSAQSAGIRVGSNVVESKRRKSTGVFTGQARHEAEHVKLRMTLRTP